MNILLLVISLQKSGISYVVEPRLSQSRRLFRQLATAIEKLPQVKSINNSLMYITFHNGSEIHYKSAEQREALRGFTVSNILVIDEANFISDEILQILKPTTTVHRATTIMVSTPTFANGYFYEHYLLGLQYNEKTNPKIKSYSWDIDKYDMSKYLPADELEQYRLTYSKQQFQAEILGEFIKDKSFIFGEFTNNIVEPEDRTPVYAGIDWGSGQGGDSTVVTFLNQFCQVVGIWETNTLQPVEQIKQIADLFNNMKSLKNVLVELNSIGRIYYDNLVSMLKNPSIISGFTTNNESKRRIIENLITAFSTGEINIIEDENLSKQLSYYSMQKTKTGYTYNAPNGFHDDYVISLALAYDAYNDKSAGGFYIG